MDSIFASKLFLVVLATFAAFRARKTLFALLNEAERQVYQNPSRALEICSTADEFTDEELVLAGCHEWLHGIRAAAKVQLSF